MLPLMLNNLNVTSARMTMPARGVWLADLDVDLDVTRTVPSGRALLTIGTKVFTGTVDERMSGRFGEKAHVQLVAGGGGWDKEVPAQHMHNDAGIVSTSVLSATAAAVGEVIADLAPKPLGVDYVRTVGPASRVLDGLDWYVTPEGITTIGPRVPVPFNPLTADILEWDPEQRMATIASDEVVMPGTILVDVRFGTATVRDVEHTFDKDGARAKAWCDLEPAETGAPAGVRLAQALGNLAREAAGVAYLKRHAYRVAVQGADGRVSLALDPSDAESGAPLILQAIDVWHGVPGARMKIFPGTRVSVVFTNGDPARPAVVGFEPSAPTQIEIVLDALRVAIGAGGAPVALATPLLAWCAKVEAALVAAGVPAVSPTAAASGITSTKLFSD